MVLTFNNKANLTTTPLAAIATDELGRTTTNGYWTGTAGGGTLGSTCQNWSDTSYSHYGTWGEGGTDTSWTAGGTIECANTLSLLCFEQ